MRRIFVHAALLGLFVALSWALPWRSAQAVLMRGMGVEDCAAWLKEQNGPDRIAYREWFLGYLSATAYLRNQDVLRDLSYDQLLARVAASCQRQPNRRLDAVLDDFFAK